MTKKVVKRSKRLQEFDPNRIFQAISKAFKACGSYDEATVRKLTDLVVNRLDEEFYLKGDIPSVESIQDIVEETLMKTGYYKVARSYIVYREKRKECRELKLAEVNAVNLIDEYIKQEDWRVRENSNTTYSLQGLYHHISCSIVARYWLEKIYPKDVKEAHVKGDIHIHDLGYLSTYCCGWDLYDLLLRGFGGVTGKIESDPPSHLDTALGQLVNFLYTLQGEAAGAQAVSNFDTLLAPFIYYDNLKYDEVKRIIRRFLFNINISTRVGFQTPFTNVTHDLVPPPTLKDMPVLIGGKLREKTYDEFQEQMDMFNRAFFEVMCEGDAKSRPFPFPIPTINITRDFPWDKEELEPLWEATRKFGIPYFANFVNSDMDPSDVRSMCCRLRLDNRELKKRIGGLFASAPLTGSINVTTINLPRIAYLSSSEDEFFDRLRRIMEVCKVCHEVKRKVLEDFMEIGLYPYAKYYLAPVKERTGKYWTNHFSTIGILGMHEACLNLLKKPIYDPEGKEFAIKVMKFMLDIIKEFQEETGNLYNLEATPAEGASYRLAKIDRRTFSSIITSGTKEAPFYTNSVHLPVNYTNDIFEILEHQDDLQVLFTGGTVVHLFLGESLPDIESVKALVKTIFENYRLPYISITPTYSICPIHGYIPGEHKYCPYPHTEEELEKYGVEVGS